MKSFAILALLVVALYAQSNEIDVVLKLLADLRNNAQSELSSLQNDWASTKQQKTDLINQLMRSTSSQRAECNQRDQDWANKERDIKITYSFINWLQKRIKENNARLQRLDVNRCESNANFIQDVKNSKKILNMIAFLRRAIKGAKETDLPALLQSAQFIQLKSYLAGDDEPVEIDSDQPPVEPADAYEDVPPYYHQQSQVLEPDRFEDPLVGAAPSGPEDGDADADQPELDGQDFGDEIPDEVPEHPHEAAEKLSDEQLQAQAEALNRIIARGKRAAEEKQAAEAAGSVPAAPGKDYSQFSAAQAELLRFLDELEGEVQGTFSKMQDNQVRSAMGYNDFKGLIQKENEAFSGHIVSEEQNAEKLQNQLITILQATAACKARLKQIQQTIDLASEDLAAAEAHFNEVSSKYQEEVNTFDDVYRIYSREVGSQSTGYKRDVQANIKN